MIEPERVKIRARGKAPGSNVDVVAAVHLEEAAAGLIRLNWTADTDLNGTVASVGARLLEGTARKLTEQFWQDFARRVAAAPSPPDEPPSPSTPSPAAA